MDQNQTQGSPNPGQGATQTNQQFQQGAAQANQQYQQYQQGGNQQYQYQQYQQGGPQYQQQYNQAPPRPNEFQKTISEVQGAFKNGQGMYSNVGLKLCVIAKIVFWIGVIYHGINCVLGIIGSIGGGGLLGMGVSVNGLGIVSALLGAALGIFVFWIASLCIYGFGQIVTKITEDKKEKE